LVFGIKVGEGLEESVSITVETIGTSGLESDIRAMIVAEVNMNRS
jgi:fructose-specific phosphotransferase system component IIB